MIIVKITDGLGNQLFQYAYALYVKEVLRIPVSLDSSDINRYSSNIRNWDDRVIDIREYELNRFNISIEEIPSKFVNKFKFYSDVMRYLSEFNIVKNITLSEADLRVAKYNRFHNYYVSGYFFTKKYNEKIRAKLLEEITLKQELQIPEKLRYIFEHENTVSIHFRRGDFLKVGRNISENKYYDKALEFIESNVGDYRLVVFSDDIEWVKNNKRFPQNTIYIGDYNYQDYEELTIMSMCKHNIIANSTYSYWGAWLNQHDDAFVVCPRGWRNAIIPDNWVRI